MKRTSRKQVEEVCGLFGFRLVKHQMLGDRKDYWYLYSIVDKNGIRIVENTTLKKAYTALLDKCRELIEGKEKSNDI